MGSWVEKTVKNMQVVIEANRKLQSGELTDVEKQSAHATASMHRCRRCGDITVGLLPEMALQRICGTCQDELQKLDGDAIWFAQIVYRINKEEEGK